MKSLLVLLVSLQLLPSFSLAKVKCKAEADQALYDMEIKGRFLKVKVVKHSKGITTPRVYRFYYRTPVCEYGYVVVRVRPYDCDVREVYTSNGCKIDGLDSWFGWLKE